MEILACYIYDTINCGVLVFNSVQNRIPYLVSILYPF